MDSATAQPKCLADAIEDSATALPESVRDLGQMHLAQIAGLIARVAELDLKMRSAAKEVDVAQRVQTMPGVGPITARAIETFAPDLTTFRHGRAFGVTLGFVPRQHSTGGKQRLGATTRMAGRSPRRLLIIGANSVIIKPHVHAAAKPGTSLGGMLTRKPPMLVRIALANKMACIVWALMARGGVYQSPAVAA